jgi:hypothetical protein
MHSNEKSENDKQINEKKALYSLCVFSAQICESILQA